MNNVPTAMGISCICPPLLCRACPVKLSSLGAVRGSGVFWVVEMKRDPQYPPLKLYSRHLYFKFILRHDTSVSYHDFKYSDYLMGFTISSVKLTDGFSLTPPSSDEADLLH